MTRSSPEPGRRDAVLRMALRLAVVGAVAVMAHLLLGWAQSQARATDNPQLMAGVLVLVFLAYVVLTAIPFVPGAEIGISLIVLQGPWIAPFVYAATVASLMLAFLVGRFVPEAALIRLFADLRMERACRLLAAVAPLDTQARLEALRARLPRPLAGLLTDWRHVVLGVLINLPGNSVLGGGGGLSMLAGLSRLFSTGGVLVTYAIAVAPVPVAVLIWGERLPIGP